MHDAVGARGAVNLSSVRRVDTQTSGPFGRGFRGARTDRDGRTSNRHSSDSDSFDMLEEKTTCFVRARNNMDKATFRARVLVSSSLSFPALRDMFTVWERRWYFAGSAALKARSSVTARLPGVRRTS